MTVAVVGRGDQRVVATRSIPAPRAQLCRSFSVGMTVWRALLREWRGVPSRTACMEGVQAVLSARIRTGTADVRRPATSRCGGMRSVTCSSPSGVKRREGRSFANREETVSLDSLRLEQLCGTAERARNRWQRSCLEPPRTYTRRARQRLVLHVLALTMRRSRSIRRAVPYRCLARERSAYGGVLKTDAPV